MFVTQNLRLAVTLKPIVITRGGDEIEWIHENIGYVTDYDSNQFKQAIFNILSDRRQRETFSVNAKLLVQNDLNWRNIVKRIESLYMETVAL